MLATLSLPQKTQTTGRDLPRSPVVATEPGCAATEIHAYLAARNLLLRETEENTNETNLRRAAAANDYAEMCLRPARPPYQAQALPEHEAARERQKCKAIKIRLAELRARLRRRAA